MLGLRVCVVFNLTTGTRARRRRLQGESRAEFWGRVHAETLNHGDRYVSFDIYHGQGSSRSGRTMIRNDCGQDTYGEGRWTVDKDYQEVTPE